MQAMAMNGAAALPLDLSDLRKRLLKGAADVLRAFGARKASDYILQMASQVQNAGLANMTAAWHAYASRAKYVGWGTGSGVAVTGTDLATPANESRVDGTSSQQTTTTANDTYRVVATLTAGGARAITEVGVFDGAGTGNPPSGANMALYGDFAVVNLASGDAITFTINAVLDQP